MDDYELQYPGRLPVIVFGDHTRVFKYVDFPFAAGADGTRLIAPLSDRVDARFFYYALCNLRLNSLGYSRHYKLLKEQIVLFPNNLSEQRKIAAILSSVDDAIEKTQAVLAQVQLVKRGVMEDLFTRYGWRTLPLVDACVARGQYGANVAKRSFEPGGIRYIRITDIDEDGTLKEAAVGIDDAAAEGYLLRAGDVLIARSGSVGKSYLHADTATGVRHAFAGYLIRFRTDPAILLPLFLKEYLNTRAYWRQVADRRRVTAQPNVNAQEYGQLAVPCPPLGEQRRVIRIAAGFNAALQAAKADLRSRQRLKQALLSALLTGELRVTPGAEEAA